jgi:hypothetical protein
MASKETLEQFGSCWEGLEDPRSGNATLHDFHELLMIALCCVLCGGQGAVEMALFAKAKEPFLRSSLTLASGLPSHDTFSRLFRNLNPDQFRDSFQRFMAQFFEQLKGGVADPAGTPFSCKSTRWIGSKPSRTTFGSSRVRQLTYCTSR